MSSRSKLPQLKSSKVPKNIGTLKRTASGELFSPEKKRRISNDVQEKDVFGNLPPVPIRRPPGKMRRSVSMTSININKSNSSLKSAAMTRVKGAAQSFSRQSDVSSSILRNRENKIIARKPISNIKNTSNKRFSNEYPNPKSTTGKSKRAPWDLKGRLMDMEEILKENCSKISDYDDRMSALETEKEVLTQNLHKTQNITQSTEEEIKLLSRQLLEEKSSRMHEKEIADRDISCLKVANQAYETKVKNLDAEIMAKSEEASGLKSRVNQLVSCKMGLEAELEATKLQLEQKAKRLEELEALSQHQAQVLADLRQKSIEDESARRQMHNTIQELKGNIRVFCRIRPLLSSEIEKKGGSDAAPHIRIIDERFLELVKNGYHDASLTGLRGRNNTYNFGFDLVFPATASQENVFEEISQLVQSALDGYNVCVFAYGQTGSGKTFTMEGSFDDEEREGVMPRTVRKIFDTARNLEEKGWNYKVDVSFIEIYNETLRDLLANPKEAKNKTYEIKMSEHKNQISVTNLKVVSVDSESKVLHLLRIAQQHRAVAATNLNEHSSRSHSVFRLTLSGYNCKTQESCEGTLNLVDLAGSERLKESGSEGARLTETQNINKSLSNLGNVIMALAQKQSHIPYRNSKLTHLLQNSLGGNSKSLMFVNISPTECCFNESLNSLRFAAKVNQCHIGTAVKQMKK